MSENDRLECGPATAFAPIPIELDPPTHRCPKCGNEEMGESLRVHLRSEPVASVFCMRCLLGWLKANIPQMEPIEEAPK